MSRKIVSVPVGNHHTAVSIQWLSIDFLGEEMNLSIEGHYLWYFSALACIEITEYNQKIV